MNDALVFSGELTIERMDESLSGIMERMSGRDEVVVDLTSVTRMDVAIIQVLLAARKECEAVGKKFSLRLSERGGEMLSQLGFGRGMVCEDV